jgi:alpha-ketoglutarate-dependent taurine dioxygenase
MANITQPGTTTTSGITVQPAAGRIGAEITGLDISQPLDPQAVTAIQEALDTWKVVFFRGQHLDHAAQIAFGRRFGDLTYAHPHDDAPPEAYPQIYTVDSRRFQQRFGAGAQQEQTARKYSYTSGWHSDVTPAINPPAGSILRATAATPHSPTWSPPTRACLSRSNASWIPCGPSIATGPTGPGCPGRARATASASSRTP